MPEIQDETWIGYGRSPHCTRDLTGNFFFFFYCGQFDVAFNWHSYLHKGFSNKHINSAGHVTMETTLVPHWFYAVDISNLIHMLGKLTLGFPLVHVSRL